MVDGQHTARDRSAAFSCEARASRLPAGVLRCGRNALASEQSAHQHADGRCVAEQAARRLGTLAILTAVTVVGMTRLAARPAAGTGRGTTDSAVPSGALFLVLASSGWPRCSGRSSSAPQELLDLGLVFEVAGAFVLGFMENSMPWPEPRSGDRRRWRHGSPFACSSFPTPMEKRHRGHRCPPRCFPLRICLRRKFSATPRCRGTGW